MLVKVISVFIILILVLACTPQSDGKQEQQKQPISILAYYVPEKDYHPDQLPLGQLTHIIFSFTNIIDGEMKFRNEEPGEKLRQLVAQKKQYPHLKMMVACGGWGADGFSDMARTDENRQIFACSAVDFNKVTKS